MTHCALFAALLALCAWICIPVSDIGITMQTFAVSLALLLLGGKWGSISIFLYLLLGSFGVPVFSGFRGGFGVLLGATGGFLWGFLFSGLAYRALERFGKLPALICGQLICYLLGCVWFSFYAGGGLGFILLRCVVPYLIPDAVKIWLALSLSGRLQKVINIPSRA